MERTIAFVLGLTVMLASYWYVADPPEVKWLLYFAGMGVGSFLAVLMIKVLVRRIVRKQ